MHLEVAPRTVSRGRGRRPPDQAPPTPTAHLPGRRFLPLRRDESGSEGKASRAPATSSDAQVCAPRPPGARTCLLGGRPGWLHGRRPRQARRGTAGALGGGSSPPRTSPHCIARRPVPEHGRLSQDARTRGCCVSSVPTKPLGQIRDHGDGVRTELHPLPGTATPGPGQAASQAAPPQGDRDHAARRPGGPPRAAAEPHGRRHPQTAAAPAESKGAYAGRCAHLHPLPVRRAPRGASDSWAKSEQARGLSKATLPRLCDPGHGLALWGAHCHRAAGQGRADQAGGREPRCQCSGGPRGQGPSSPFGAQPRTGRQPLGKARTPRSRPPHMVTGWRHSAPAGGGGHPGNLCPAPPGGPGPPNLTPTTLLFTSPRPASSSDSTALLILVFFKKWIRKIASGKLINV